MNISIPGSIIKSKLHRISNFYSFMSVILPCGDTYLRAACTQRPSRRTLHFEKLDHVVEREMAILLAQEIDFQLKLE